MVAVPLLEVAFAPRFEFAFDVFRVRRLDAGVTVESLFGDRSGSPAVPRVAARAWGVGIALHSFPFRVAHATHCTQLRSTLHARKIICTVPKPCGDHRGFGSRRAGALEIRMRVEAKMSPKGPDCNHLCSRSPKGNASRSP